VILLPLDRQKRKNEKACNSLGDVECKCYGFIKRYFFVMENMDLLVK
jgi:hypothetical protein